MHVSDVTSSLVKRSDSLISLSCIKSAKILPSSDQLKRKKKRLKLELPALESYPHLRAHTTHKNRPLLQPTSKKKKPIRVVVDVYFLITEQTKQAVGRIRMSSPVFSQFGDL